MPSQRVLSQLLKKSFDIVSEIADDSTGNNSAYRDLQDLKDLIKSKQSDQARAGAAKKKSGYKISSYEDPFSTTTTISQTDSKPRRTPKLGNMPISQAVRLYNEKKKAKHNYVEEDFDYGEKQKQIQQKRSAKMLLCMFGLIGVLVVLVAIGLN